MLYSDVVQALFHIHFLETEYKFFFKSPYIGVRSSK
jgi:hypothetical protein